MNCAIFSNMVQHMIGKCKAHPVRATRSHFQKFAPVYMIGVGAILILCDLVRHLMNDAWGTHCDERDDFSVQTKDLPAKYSEVCYGTGFASMYNTDGSLNTLGLLLSVIFTWTGFVLLFSGILYGIDFHRKVRLQWRTIREGRSGGRAPTSTARGLEGFPVARNVVEPPARGSAPLLENQV
ncbi:unnamed protein product [Amoebophrya sp. A25]|nr:unnamed protein product [Amoebophrya sp. A25]|eukprot:GSA25T00008527001.1